MVSQAARQPVNVTAEPWKAVARIDFFDDDDKLRANASGALIASNRILTAKHIFRHDEPFKIILGYDGTTGSGVATTVIGPPKKHPSRDLAIVEIDPLDILPFGIALAVPSKVIISGYPQQSRKQLAAEGACAADGQDLRYSIPVKRGDSGAPVFIWDGAMAQLVAVHREKFDGKGVGELIAPQALADLEF